MTSLNCHEAPFASADQRNGALLTSEQDTSKPDGEIDMMLDSTPAVKIRELELSYTERVNMAVAGDRLDLIDELVADFEAELSRLQQAA